MPLTRRGRKLKRKLEAEYGKEKGEQVFYAMENKKKGLRRRGRTQSST